MKKFKNIFSLLILILVIFANQVLSQRWEKVTSIQFPYSNNYWLDVYFHPSNPNYGWVCGFNGMVAYTTDGGNSWQGSTINNAYHLESIHFPSLTVGYCSGVDGIFKSTDGGRTWTDITPAGTRDTTAFWGCFFLTENYGMVVGDGCGSNRQHFWLTTDGGNTWSVFIGNELNSGMTDVLLYNDGTGYAVSSGRLWLSTDFGQTWRVFANSGPNYWQEEITKYGNSFLVPYSGNSCTGGGNDGGMRFSTNFGSTWVSYQTGTPMFGTFLIDAQKGWACGYSRAVYYSSNAGVTWIRKNCGIENGNLDDIWFINENNGWVVGEGIYKLSPPIGRVSRTILNFGETCVGKAKFDTLYFSNINFNDATISLSLTGNTEDFQILSPGTTGYVQSCDSIRIIVMFLPKSNGGKNATLQISAPYQSPITVQLRGSGAQSTAKLLDTLLIFDNVRCGQSYEKYVTMEVSASGEKIISIAKTEGNAQVSVKNTIPMDIIPATPNKIYFTATATDTGWTTTRFRFYLFPCDTPFFVSVKVYGKSPIIKIDSTFHFDFICKVDTILIPIANVGNDTLKFDDIDFSPKNNNIAILGWKSQNTLLKNIILPKQADTLVIAILPNFEGSFSSKLIIKNNDFTTQRGSRNNLSIPITIQVLKPEISVVPTTIDFGKLCIRDTATKYVAIHNRGNLDEILNKVIIQNQGFRLTPNFSVPKPIKQKDSILVPILFNPAYQGIFEDTIYFTTSECPDTFKIYVRGECVIQKIDYLPKEIRLRLTKNSLSNQKVTIWNLSNYDLVFTSHKFGSLPTDSIEIKAENLIDSIIKANDTLNFNLTISGKEKGKWTTKLFITLAGICNFEIEIPITIEIIDKDLLYGKYYNFGKILCEPRESETRIKFFNLSEIPDTINQIQIVQKFNQFAFKNLSTQPFIIPSRDSISLEISYSPTILGYDTAFVLLLFDDTQRNDTIIVEGFFGKSIIKLDTNRIVFGKFEYCENPVSKKIVIRNTGNIPDTCIITKPFGIQLFGWKLDNIFIEPSDSIVIEISFSPERIYGIFNDSLELAFSTCNIKEQIIVEAEIFIPNYSISPKSIDAGEIWMGTQKPISFDIQNKSNQNLGLRLSPSSNYSINLKFDNNVSFDLKQNEAYKLTVNIVASEEGEFSDTLIVEINSNCIYFDTLIVHYIIPKEIYELILSVGKYFVKPGDLVNIEIENLTPTNLLKLDTLEFELLFDDYLFYPIETFLSFNKEKIETRRSTNKLSFTLVGKQIESFLQSLSKIVVNGRALYSSPDSTILDLQNLVFTPSKNISAMLNDGLLKVSPICHPVAGQRLEFIDMFNLQNYSFDDGRIIFKIYSQAEQMIEFKAFNLLGNEISKEAINLMQGENEFCFEHKNLFASQTLIFIFQNNTQSISIIVPVFRW